MLRRKRHAKSEQSIVVYTSLRVVWPWPDGFPLYLETSYRPGRFTPVGAGIQTPTVSSGFGDRGHQRTGLERYRRNVVEAMGFAQGEQALGLGGEGMDPGLGPGLAPVDAVVVPARADLRPLRREFARVRLVATFRNGLGVSDDEQSAQVFIATGLRSSWTQAWPAFRNYS